MGIARDCLRVPALRMMTDMAVPAAYRKYFLSVLFAGTGIGGIGRNAVIATGMCVKKKYKRGKQVK